MRARTFLGSIFRTSSNRGTAWLGCPAISSAIPRFRMRPGFPGIALTSCSQIGMASSKCPSAISCFTVWESAARSWSCALATLAQKPARAQKKAARQAGRFFFKTNKFINYNLPLQAKSEADVPFTRRACYLHECAIGYRVVHAVAAGAEPIASGRPDEVRCIRQVREVSAELQINSLLDSK